jgi:hypothetical protein
LFNYVFGATSDPRVVAPALFWFCSRHQESECEVEVASLSARDSSASEAPTEIGASPFSKLPALPTRQQEPSTSAPASIRRTTTPLLPSLGKESCSELPPPSSLAAHLPSETDISLFFNNALEQLGSCPDVERILEQFVHSLATLRQKCDADILRVQFEFKTAVEVLNAHIYFSRGAVPSFLAIT